LLQCLPHKNDDKNIYDFKESKGLIYYNWDFFSSTKVNAITHSPNSHHDLPFVKHFGVNKIIKFISRDFLWSQMWKFVICVCKWKHRGKSAIWFITTIPSCWKSMVIFLYGVDHSFFMFQILQLHSCGDQSIDKYGTFYTNHLDCDKWRYHIKCFWQHI
jgi:hypothetical protein